MGQQRLLVLDQLVVTHVSTHVSQLKANALAKKDRITKIIQLTCETMSRVKASPRIAVAGLNPHAGENGLFEDEEIPEVKPAVEWVVGPFEISA